MESFQNAVETSGADTISELLAEGVRLTPGTNYLEDARSARAYDYATIAAAARAWSQLLDELDIPSGGAVLLTYRDPLAFAAAHLGVIAAGRRSVPVASDASATDLLQISNQLGGAAIVVSDRGLTVPGASVVGVDADSGRPFVVSRSTSSPSTPGALKRGAAVLFTSGSTGTPKGVELGEEQLLFVARQIVANTRLTAADRGFNSLPLFHVNAEVVGLLSTLIARGTLVLDASFHRTGFWELLRERHITWLNAVPAMLAVLTRDGSTIPDIGLRFIRSASAPLPEPVREALGSIPVILSWGMTEGASQITATVLDAPVRPGSVGLPTGTEVTVRTADGSIAGPNEIGALWVRGPGVVKSFLFGRAAERFDEDGWLSTGDIGRLDEDGWVYLVSRGDDVINRGGEKVYPAEVEEVLLRDERVLEAVVVAKPDPVLGQIPIAYIITAPDTDTDGLVDDLLALTTAELPRFKRPMTVAIVPDLPRASTGKVQRAKVRDLAASES